MYTMILKNRMQEHNILTNHGSLFKNDEIVPLIEIINLKINRTIFTEEELIKFYDKNISSSYFIDYFSFDPEVYKPVSFPQLTYSLELNGDSKEEYLGRLLKTTSSEKAIPVVSIKSSREEILSFTALNYIITNLQKHKKNIAIRIEGRLFSVYKDLISKIIRVDDYLFFDINEEQLDPFVMDLFDLEEVSAKKILINSPRKRDQANGSYLESGYTALVDMFAREKYIEQGFIGYADYGGLKDDLPKAAGGGMGAALAMLYNGSNNKFYTITNKDTQVGVKGYDIVLNKMYSEEVISELNGDDCFAYEFVKERMLDRGRTGNWAQWNYVTLLRTLSEIKKVYR